MPGSDPSPIVIEHGEPPVTVPERPQQPTNGGPAPQGTPAPVVGTTPAPPAARAPVARAVRKAVSVQARAPTAVRRRGGRVTVRLTIVASKALAGKRVAIERRIGRRVVTIARVKVGASGRVTATLRLQPAASYRLRVRAAQTATTRAAASPFALVKVRAAAQPLS